jgi:hypothetical protein
MKETSSVASFATLLTLSLFVLWFGGNAVAAWARPTVALICIVNALAGIGVLHVWKLARDS